MTDAHMKEHEDDTVNIPGYINVGGWCCCKHLFRVDIYNAATQDTCMHEPPLQYGVEG